MTRSVAEIKAELETLKAQHHRYNDGMNEGGDGYSPYATHLRTLQAEYDQAAETEVEARITAITAAEEALWTLEYTQARRAEWNTWVRSQGKTLHPATVANRVKEQGWSLEALKRAIKRHGL